MNVMYIKHNKSDSVVTTAFYKSFPMKRISRNKAKDKPWVTNALKKSSRIKNALYKKWVKTRSSNDEIRYKRYRNIYKKVATEAENSYYNELFYKRTNSVKQLWKNLNTLSCFNQKKYKKNISKLHYNNKELTEQTDICNGFSNYFSTVGQTLLDQLNSTNTATTTQDFRVFCDK